MIVAAGRNHGALALAAAALAVAGATLWPCRLLYGRFDSRPAETVGTRLVPYAPPFSLPPSFFIFL
jgi:hypothetical protein